jgi:hypothetical protein
MQNIAEYWSHVQRSLFPALAEALPEGLTARHRQLVWVLDILRIEQHVPPPHRSGPGHPVCDRRPLARAFLAKACFNLPTTVALWDRLLVDPVLRRLCGWEKRRDLPSLSTFSRAFAEFAVTGVLDAAHRRAVQDYTAETPIWHLSRDSTAIRARERPAPKPPATTAPENAVPRKRGRPRKGETRPPPPPTRLERQYATPLTETAALLAELPRQCDVGTKKNAQGHAEHWVGYKLHLDTGDTGLPVFAVTTAASLHDSQVAIPMTRETQGRVTVFYALMDAAYDAQPIHAATRELGQVPIIAGNPRRGQALEVEPDRARRYGQRSEAERVNARLKDDFGGRMVRVRGAAKVHAHLMCGVLVLFACVIHSWLT